ncbi:hypothetical protein M2475_001810 [Breznakia sp. PF5-3]|uniref:hypothetical protein n=1 Tax=unclassified Breznakia TaxID=2623764 RepID=UPI0024065486|nr:MULTISPECIES: hypothetical protein [unclassified Breznakia]MDF9825355.1 hypothetical protein [Breznakia sp. PM6-1]MDF9836233.1 hypothetical protein [Breznakia sp. PF5-3]MDF9838527.1 hypothetical protein [Breznakia sp. PFB2-8]MDF9860478.1 hypothetical protein [Breznakia sp. PH5-24]
MKNGKVDSLWFGYIGDTTSYRCAIYNPSPEWEWTEEDIYTKQNIKKEIWEIVMI